MSILYFLARGLILLIQWLPLPLAARLGRFGGALAFRLDARHRRVALENLQMCFGGELVYSKRFADHHRFTQQEILNAINRGKKRQAQIIVTTQKDAVRFPKIDRRDLPIYFMRVEIQIVSGANDFQDCVRKICFK